jgi:hypothetical protein
MPKWYAALRGALCAAGVSAQLLWGSASWGSLLPAALKTKGGKRARSHAARSQASSATESDFAALAALLAQEPPPAGDQVVLWALPSKRLPVRIVASPSRGATKLGEARGATALEVVPPLLPGARGSCRQWLAAVPAGYVCASDVTLQPGYASTPPAQESATGWQRYRYGVVTAKVASVRNGAGTYLRATLHKGDGVTVVRQVEGQAQLIGQKWLASKDLELATPATLPPVYFANLPPGTQPAWIVPAAGESQAPAYPPGGRTPTPSSIATLPRYCVVWIDSEPAASPGRVLVQLPESTRTLLKDTPEAQAARVLEVDAAVLRRFTRSEPPAELGPDERWIDISLRDQVATAYAGTTPLFASLVSTGKGNTTPPGTFFIYRKYLTQTMANQRDAEAQYDFREVPHAQFFNGRIGLHAVLWHDSLGHPVSHGCVNMSPATAQEFFGFAGPLLPPGWHSVTGSAPAAGHGAEAAGPGSPALTGTRVVVRR